MKIDICLMACNDNETYYSFFPYVKEIWEKILNVKCILIYVGNNIPELLIPYEEDIILFKPIENMHTAFIAQNIRLLYPALLKCENGVLISDIDIIPLSKGYFTEQIKDYDNDVFINYTYEPKCDIISEYYICYNVASSETWSKIFNINSIDDINNTLIDWYSSITYIFDNKYRSKCVGFHNDQLMLYKYVNMMPNKELIILLPRIISRYEIGRNKIIRNKQQLLDDINNNIWYDFHMPKNINKNDLLFIKNNI